MYTNSKNLTTEEIALILKAVPTEQIIKHLKHLIDYKELILNEVKENGTQVTKELREEAKNTIQDVYTLIGKLTVLKG